MRICFVSQQIAEIRTGVGTYANSLIPAVAAAGHGVAVIGRGTRPAWPDVAYHAVPGAPADPTPEGWLSFAWLAARRLRELAASARFDVVHFVDAREALFAHANGRVPFVGTVHDCYLAAASPRPSYWRRRYGDWARRWAYHVVARRLERTALRRLRLLIANSRYVEREVAAGYALPAGALRTVYYGFRLDWAPAPGGERRAPPEVLFVGANFERKGLPGLLRALAQVKDRVPDARLHVVGDHPSRPRMAALAAALGLGERVVFHGFLGRADVGARYRAAAVVALPSEVEGFGIALLEAMHAGVPVVASTQGGSGELVQDGRDGYLVAPGDVPALADRLLRLLTDERRRAEMGASARRTAEGFTLARMVDATVAVYRDARGGA
jgi:glycosyltransferase involved in cell wall biosynthesis